LPANIKKGTEVVVSFNYLSSGRIHVVAEIPILNISADTAINRAEGMTRADILSWKEKLDSDADLLDSEETPKMEPQTAVPPQLKNQKPPLPAITPAIRLPDPEKPTISEIKITKQKPNRKIDIPSEEEMFLFDETSSTSTPGDSALDFLNETNKPSAGGSELDDFLSDLDVD
jgi:hypothetical protein